MLPTKKFEVKMQEISIKTCQKKRKRYKKEISKKKIQHKY